MTANIPSFPVLFLFPNLQELVVVDKYPFSDNTLFRGSQCSLHQLKMELDNDAVENLKDSREFAIENGHKDLECVKLDVTCYSKQCNYHYYQLFGDIAKHARLGMFDCYFVKYPLDETEISNFGQLQSIQVLNISTVKITFKTAIQLIKQLPNLVQLTIAYCPLSHEFRELFVHIPDKRATVDEVMEVAIIAILCPNFGNLPSCVCFH